MQSFIIELDISALLEQIINGWFRSDSHGCLCPVSLQILQAHEFYRKWKSHAENDGANKLVHYETAT